MTDRAVSEVIAFILVFSIVITSVGLLYSVGFGSLNQIQASEQDRSAEQGMRAVAVAFDDIQRDRGSVRQASLDLSGRSLFVEGGNTLTVDPSSGKSASIDGALIYGRGEDTEIAYHSGAVIRSQGSGAELVRRAPRFRCADDHAVISLVESGNERNGSVSSDSSVQIEAQRADPSSSRVVVAEEGISYVDIDYSGSRYTDAWSQYFKAQEEWDNDVASGTATCNFNPSGDVYVRKTVLDISFSPG